MFRNYKSLGERAIAQVPDDDLNRRLDPDANSIAVIVKHIAGNLRSRFRDFLTTDGEKPDRHRDSEFEIDRPVGRDEMLRWWESGWTTALAAVEALTPEDLDRTVFIRTEEFLVIEALDRAATHVAYHVGEIVLLAKHCAGPGWVSLSIPKGRSADFTAGQYKQGPTPRH